MNGVCTKLEKENVLKFLPNYDTVALSEIKTNLRISLPDYVAFRSACVEGHRGGAMVLIHKSLSNCIMNVDTCVRDQVWLQLTVLGAIMLRFCYVSRLTLCIMTQPRLVLYRRSNLRGAGHECGTNRGQ